MNGRAVESGRRTPDERSSGTAGSFLALRRSLVQTREGDGGLDVCALLSDELDRVLAQLGEAAGEGVSVVATGGYGRREMSLFSDVDLMLLHDGSVSADRVREVFYPLWDAGLRVGHSVRTAREAIEASREHVETFTSLLTSRLVWGDRALMDELSSQLARLFRRERARLERAIEEQERQRRITEPYPLIEADLKTGRGGLRVLHAVDWVRRGAALLDEPVDGPDDDEEEARKVLLAVRNALHASTGRQMDRFTATLRPAAAEWLGDDVGAVSRRLHQALRRGDLLSQRWFAAHGGNGSDPVTATGRWLVRAVRSRSDRATVDEAGFPLAQAAKVIAAGGPPVLGPTDRHRVATAPVPVWTEDDRRSLVRLIGGGRRGRDLFDQLIELGWVGRAIPEWSHVVAAPQFDPVHLHTVDGHLWRTVDELLEIAGPESTEGWCREFADDLGNLDELLLAAFFHDIGKGLEGDHAEVGARLTAGFAARIGLGSRARTMMERIVRHHLLLPQVATRRDTDDPEVIAGIADLIGDEPTLRSLALLTVADARATGPSMWNEWKRVLVSGLVFKVMDELRRRRKGLPVPPDADAVVRIVERSGDGVSGADVESHIAGMPDGYLSRFTPDEIVRHLAAATPPPEPGEAGFDVDHRYPVSSLVLATRDRPGLLVDVAGVLALHNVSVLDARLATRTDGVAIDTFHVADALGTGGIGKARWPEIRKDLRATMTGALDLEQRLAAKARSYPAAQSDGGDVRIREISGSTVVEVRCGDRIGLLHDLAAAIVGCGFDVTLAKVDTRADRVVDVFYLRPTDADGPEQIDRLRVSLEAVVGLDASL